MTSKFVKHEPCPHCGSKDNLGVWDDGHKWCFGCGYFVPGSAIETFRSFKVKEKEKPASIPFPSGTTNILGPFGKLWLDRYQITPIEIFKYRILWSNHGVTLQNNSIISPLLIFPIYDDSNFCIFWQGRNFSSVQKNPKYYSRGNKEAVNAVLGGSDKDTVFLVEDMLSAIKVARFAKSFPLFGSDISPARAKKLSEKTRHIVLWLDPDKYQSSSGKSSPVLILKRQLTSLFENVDVLYTSRDPKDYANDEIKRFINQY